ncbi:uncharacterized protein N7496_001739 [Penicillium cataractarum]|uniref:Uncharacterized protein n=1 Tax=Penicillium cataractarum TaxID=2100454 RepID=A0A9W9VWJ0_9EURO|nr:uncharacterized protein N7496_001739 [Penicillium cataractarum]KAJ5390671.1 hypothetical protein N7496_001739 [Penicillium cataractarum]
MQTLLRWGANPGRMDSTGKTPLSRAVKSRSIRGVDLLLQFGAGNMTGPANLEDDPLTVVLDSQDENILRLLLKNGVHSSRAITLQGSSALHVAIQLNRPRMLQVLLEEGVDPDRQDQLGRTALHFAALAHSLEIARILVEFGANAQLTDNQDETPHHVAAADRQILLLQYLLMNDPDTVVREFFLKTPIDEYDSPEVEAVLLIKGPMGSRLARLLQDHPDAKALRAQSANRKGRR